MLRAVIQDPKPQVKRQHDPWLVVIDMQPIFRDEKLKNNDANPWCVPGFQELVPKINKLVQKFPERVVYTRFVPSKMLGDSWVSYYETYKFAVEQDADMFDIVGDLDAKDAEIISALTFGKHGKSLHAATGGSKNLVLCGVSSSCCVLSTALEAVGDGAWVRVLKDACWDIAEGERHEKAMSTMDLYWPQIEVCSMDDV